jgi:hypothetical protein
MMYDFRYKTPATAWISAFMPLEIEGAPDHGTIADAQVWAAHYDVRIDLLDGAGRVRRVVGPDGQMQQELDIAEARKRAWALGLDWQAEVDGAAETGESVATRVGRLWEIENTPSDDLAQLDQIYLSAPLCQRERAIVAINARMRAPTCAQWVKFGEPRERSCYFIVRGADRAMSGKTTFLDDLAGLRRLQTDMRAFQVEKKQPKSARARHLSGVSVDLLIAVGHRAQRLGFWGLNEIDLFDTNGGA